MLNTIPCWLYWFVPIETWQGGRRAQGLSLLNAQRRGQLESGGHLQVCICLQLTADAANEAELVAARSSSPISHRLSLWTSSFLTPFWAHLTCTVIWINNNLKSETSHVQILPAWAQAHMTDLVQAQDEAKTGGVLPIYFTNIGSQRERHERGEKWLWKKEPICTTMLVP